MNKILILHGVYLIIRPGIEEGLIEDGAVYIEKPTILAVEPGKEADFITIELKDNTALFPLSPGVVYSIPSLNVAGSEVCDVLVNGIFVRRNSEFTFLDKGEIIAHAREWRDKFSADYHQMKKAHKPMFIHFQPEFQLSEKESL